MLYNRLRFFLHLSIMVLFVSGQAMAAETEASSDDVFVPTSGWLVGPASLLPPERGAGNMPCIMANQFDNGFTFRLSGGGNKLHAIAVDFRQPAFRPGQTYGVDLTAGNNFNQRINAQAYDPATLLINIDAHPALYKLIGEGAALGIQLGDKVLRFAMLGAGDGLRRVEQCYNGGSGATARQASAAAPAEALPAIDPSYSQAVGNGGAQTTDTTMLTGMRMITSPPPAPVGEATPVTAQQEVAPQPAAPAQPQVPGQAQQGQTVSADPQNGGQGDTPSLVDRMLAQASQTTQPVQPATGAIGLQAALQPKPPRAVQIAPAPIADSAKSGEATAVAAPSGPAQVEGGALARNWTDSTVRAPQGRDIVYGQRRAFPSTADQTETIPPETVAAATAGGSTQPVPPPAADRRWRAANGSNLKDILAVWANKEQARLVWMAGKDYQVPKNVSTQGDFESAVSGLLEQYQGEAMRPVGRIYRDPQSGQKVLVVEGG